MSPKRTKYAITPERDERITDVLKARQNDLTLVLSNIHDPHNVSAILRSCDAFGVPRVYLYYTDTPFPVMGRKSSASARKWVERERHGEAEPMIAGLRDKGFQILGTGFSEKALAVNRCDFTRPTAVILGNEHRGLDPELELLIDHEVYIPMHGMIKSLNVSVAAAVILYEAWRQRSEKGMFDETSLSPKEYQRLYEEWKQK